MDSVFRVKPIGNSKTKSYGVIYDTLEEAMKESYFYLCRVASNEPDIDEANIEYRICYSDDDDTETTLYKAHIKYIFNPKQKLIKEIKILSSEIFPVNNDLIRKKNCKLTCTQGDEEWETSYPNLVIAMRNVHRDWSRGYINFDIKKKMKVVYTTHGKTLFEGEVRILWNKDVTKGIQFIKIRDICKEEHKKSQAEWKAFCKKMEGREISL